MLYPQYRLTTRGKKKSCVCEGTGYVRTGGLVCPMCPTFSSPALIESRIRLPQGKNPPRGLCENACGKIFPGWPPPSSYHTELRRARGRDASSGVKSEKQAREFCLRDALGKKSVGISWRTDFWSSPMLASFSLSMSWYARRSFSALLIWASFSSLLACAARGKPRTNKQTLRLVAKGRKTRGQQQ